MDSKCFKQTAGEGHISQPPHGPSYGNNDSNVMDLTLRLGLSHYHNQTHHEQNASPMPIPPPNSNLNLHDPSTQATNQYGMDYQPGYDTSRVSWSSDVATPYMNSNGLGNSSGSSVRLPGFSDSYNFIPYLAPTPPMKNYAITSGPQGMIEFEAGSSSVSHRKYARRQRADTGSLNIEKRCSNPNCNTNDTPMWRKGPLGPKTLCNACGIKYRKDEERRRGKGVAKPSGHG